MNEKLKKVCLMAKDGKISPEKFYDALTAAADDQSTDDDLACILEDVIMELEMEHGCPPRAAKKMISEAAERILSGAGE